MAGEDGLWRLEHHLMAAIADGVNVGNWQRGARKGSRPPRPLPRPGVKPEGKKVGSTVLPIDELRARLHEFGPEGGD